MTESDFIELIIEGMSTILHPAEAYALVLKEVGGERRLPVIIGAHEAQSIRVIMANYKFPRPLTHDLMVNLMEKMDIHMKKAVIYKVEEGVFYSYIYMEYQGEEFKLDARTSDAIALALRCGVPLYTLRTIMEHDHMSEDAEGHTSVTVNTVDLPELKRALEKAIRTENYELAASLRDEIRRREEEQKQ
ncbi:bifunctional nuclease family protein [Phocaeicola oris]|uniref:bifunctional nuclease family protein n=1 Tax=Phocaeicola oris TaxID=2896850 RepID=UPI00234F7B21|nr:bifunctional nuclease family protein [Phocaeicola oris]MCE2615445.1 bifunctional nuclease family protein [Phocaeicola oris]